ncbi:hypothetical protein CCR75_004730 [Bremia lactucae]|uniref:Uncharacterized protein n=1 Tax=Bremia lactucae TaxID=4779 RepID=A0A976NZB5_BRELC|nr:hypothetical protein CCR75_004730 [Bremia lactucae]
MMIRFDPSRLDYTVQAEELLNKLDIIAKVQEVLVTMSLQLSTSHESVTAAAKLGIIRDIAQSHPSEKDTNKN